MLNTDVSSGCPLWIEAESLRCSGQVSPFAAQAHALQQSRSHLSYTDVPFFFCLKKIRLVTFTIGYLYNYDLNKNVKVSAVVKV